MKTLHCFNLKVELLFFHSSHFIKFLPFLKYFLQMDSIHAVTHTYTQRYLNKVIFVKSINAITAKRVVNAALFSLFLLLTQRSFCIYLSFVIYVFIYTDSECNIYIVMMMTYLLTSALCSFSWLTATIACLHVGTTFCRIVQ